MDISNNKEYVKQLDILAYTHSHYSDFVNPCLDFAWRGQQKGRVLSLVCAVGLGVSFNPSPRTSQPT